MLWVAFDATFYHSVVCGSFAVSYAAKFIVDDKKIRKLNVFIWTYIKNQRVCVLFELRSTKTAAVAAAATKNVKSEKRWIIHCH